MNEELKQYVVSRLKEYALIGERRRMLIDELNGMNLYNPNTSQLKEGQRAKNRKKDISDLLVVRDDKLAAYMAIHEVYCLCCCYIYDLPIREKGIESILRYIKGEIVAKGALLNKVATEIAMTCSDSDIDRYLPSMLKSAVK